MVGAGAKEQKGSGFGSGAGDWRELLVTVSSGKSSKSHPNVIQKSSKIHPNVIQNQM